MNENSIESWHRLKEDGTLSLRHAQVLQALETKGPCLTAAQITMFVPGGWKRVSELIAMGAIEQHGNVYSIVTHRKVGLYRIVMPFPALLKPLPKSKLTQTQADAFIEGARRMAELLDNGNSTEHAMQLIKMEAK
jgi:hypothetical protein